MNKKWLKAIKIIGFTLLLALSLALIFNRQIKDTVIESYKPKVTQKTVKKANTKKANYDFKQVKSLDLQSAMKARFSSDDIQLGGQILIPSAGLHLPIGLGVSNETLALAAGTMRADQKMGEGNYPLAGHHMVAKDVLFGPLYYKTAVGAKVYLTDMKKVYVYKVYQRKFIAATDVKVVDQTKQKIVTLITCDATGAGRLMVRGALVDQYALNQADSKIKRAFNGPVNSAA